MLVIPFSIEKHSDCIKEMLNTRLMAKEYVDTLPAYGLIAIKDGEPIAYGAIRTIEGGYAMLDSYITNGSASPELRNRALDIITYKLIKTAKENNITGLFAFSQDKSIFERSVRHGMEHIPHDFTVIYF